MDGAQLISGTAIDNEVVSLENFAAGVYFVTVISAGKNEVYKVVKD